MIVDHRVRVPGRDGAWVVREAILTEREGMAIWRCRVSPLGSTDYGEWHDETDLDKIEDGTE